MISFTINQSQGPFLISLNQVFREVFQFSLENKIREKLLTQNIKRFHKHT